MKKYRPPEFLEGVVPQEAYERWLDRKAKKHVKRDRARGNQTATVEQYKTAIHQAVEESNGKDAYTNEELNWFLLSQYDNEQSKKHGRKYKKAFALLPSLDHVGNGIGLADFKICAWRTNDAKNDLSYEEFLELSHKVIRAEKSRAGY